MANLKFKVGGVWNSIVTIKGDKGNTGDKGEQGIPGGNITNASQLPYTPTGDLSSTNVQTALAELDSEKASKTQENWQTLTPLNGWTGSLQCYKDTVGIVRFRGRLSGGLQASLTVLVTPPTGYRLLTPAYMVIQSSAQVRVMIDNAGIRLNGAIATTFLDFDGLSYRAEV